MAQQAVIHPYQRQILGTYRRHPCFNLAADGASQPRTCNYRREAH